MQRVGFWWLTLISKIGNETLARSWRRAERKEFPRSLSDRVLATAGTFGSSFPNQSLRQRPAVLAPFWSRKPWNDAPTLGSTPTIGSFPVRTPCLLVGSGI